MTTETEYRFLNAHDESAVLAIFLAAQSQYAFPMGGAWTAEKLAEELKLCAGACALQRGQLEAFVIFRKSTDHIDVTFLATHPKNQKKGRIVSLLKWLGANIKPPRAIWLEVHAQNKPAISAYLRAGFIQSGLRKSYYQDGQAALLFEYKPLQ
jgi:ribosomal protein S18 acetylase RimI-like enzyme